MYLRFYMCKQGVTYSLYVGFSSMWGNFSMHSCLSSGIYTNIVHLNKICLNHCLYENSGCYIGGQIYLLSPTGSYVWAFISHAWQGRKWNSAVCDVNKPLLVTELSPCMPILQSLHLGMRLWVKLFMSLSENLCSVPNYERKDSCSQRPRLLHLHIYTR